MELHEIIKAMRLEMGFSQQTLAGKLRVSFAAVNRWENQRTKPTKIAVYALIKLAKSRKINKELIEQLEMIEFHDN